MRNNGLVEIRDDESHMSDSVEFEEDDQNTTGEVYSLPTTGVIVDFISKAKSDKKIEDELALRAQQSLNNFAIKQKAQSQYEMSRLLRGRSLLDSKIALNLVRFKTGSEEFHDLTDDGLNNLSYVLQAEAPDEIVDDPAYARSSHDSAIASERKQLELLQALIKRKLDVLAAAPL